MGRKPKLTPELHTQLLKLLSSTAPVVTCCDAVGISERIFYIWMDKGGKATKGIYFQLFQEVTQQRAIGELSLLDVVEGAANGTGGRPADWRAASWLLQVRRPAHYKPATRVEHAGSDGGPLPLATGSSITPIINVQITGDFPGKTARVRAAVPVAGTPGEN